MAHAAGSSAALAAAPEVLRSEILAVDPGLSLTPVVSLSGYTELGVLPQRAAAAMATGLAALALLLSGLGIYGVVAYAVATRTREIGIRMALGADRGKVIGMVIRDGITLVLPGLVVAAPLGMALALLLRGFIIGVAPLDPLALGGVAILLLGVIALASLAPARRAASVEPVEALRYE